MPYKKHKEEDHEVPPQVPLDMVTTDKVKYPIEIGP